MTICPPMVLENVAELALVIELTFVGPGGVEPADPPKPPPRVPPPRVPPPKIPPPPPPMVDVVGTWGVAVRTAPTILGTRDAL